MRLRGGEHDDVRVGGVEELVGRQIGGEHGWYDDG